MQEGKWVYAQFHLISDQGVKNLTDPEEAAKRSLDSNQKDLYYAIDKGE